MRAIMLIAVCLLACSCGKKAPLEVTKITLHQARSDYVNLKIRTMENSQFAGHSSAGVSGGAELYKLLREEAREVFPDGLVLYKAHLVYGRKVDESKYESVFCSWSYGYYVEVKK